MRFLLRRRADIDETMAEVFQTAAIKLSTTNGTMAPLAPFHPNSRGFDDFYGFCSATGVTTSTPDRNNRNMVEETDLSR